MLSPQYMRQKLSFYSAFPFLCKIYFSKSWHKFSLWFTLTKMKKPIFCVLFFWAAMTVGAQNVGATLFVVTRTAEVKASSGFFARSLGTLVFGDAVTVQQNQGRWLVVRSASGLQGWVLAGAFSTRRIIQSGSGVTTTEFALAGKGFTSDLEEILRSTGEIDFSDVDAMEERTISPEELRAFLREGRLAEGD